MINKELQDLLASLLKTQKETSEQMKLSQKEADKERKEAKEQRKEAKEQRKERSRELAEMLQSHKELCKMVGGISNSQGDVAEEFFINSISTTRKVGGIQYDVMDINVKRHIKDTQDEFDVVLTNGHEVMILEIKYKLNKKDIERLLTTKYTNFKKLYPQYKDYNIRLGLASFKVFDDVKQEALDNNIMILQRKGDIIEGNLYLSLFDYCFNIK